MVDPGLLVIGTSASRSGLQGRSAYHEKRQRFIRHKVCSALLQAQILVLGCTHTTLLRPHAMLKPNVGLYGTETAVTNHEYVFSNRCRKPPSSCYPSLPQRLHNLPLTNDTMFSSAFFWRNASHESFKANLATINGMFEPTIKPREIALPDSDSSNDSDIEGGKCNYSCLKRGTPLTGRHQERVRAKVQTHKPHQSKIAD